MSDMNEEMFDAMIKVAGREVMRREMDAMPSEDDIDVTFTSGFERKMKRLIKRKRYELSSIPVKMLRYAAVFVAIISVSFTSAFALVPPFRELVVKATIEWTGVSANFTFTESYESLSDGIRPGYIPEGFVEVNYWEGYTIIDITYADDTSREFYYSRGGIGSGSILSIDSEHSDYYKDIINGMEAHIFVSNEEGYPSYIIFNDNTFSYSVNGYISIEELLLIAESVPFEK